MSSSHPVTQLWTPRNTNVADTRCAVGEWATITTWWDQAGLSGPETGFPLLVMGALLCKPGGVQHLR